MQTRSSDENSVRPSVCLSNACIVTKRKKDMPRFLYHTKDQFSLVFWEKEQISGRRGRPSTWNFGSTGPRLSEIIDFEPIFARSASAVTPSEKSLINNIRKSTTCFPMRSRWTSYVVPKPPKGGSKRKVSKIWTVSCDNSETVRDRM